MTTKDNQFLTVLDSVVATGAGITLNVKDYQNVTFTIATSDSASGILKVQWDAQSTPTTFGSAASISNPRAYINFVNTTTWSGISGTTGVVYTGTDGVNIIEVNTNKLSHLTINLTARAAGTFKVTAMMGTNE